MSVKRKDIKKVIYKLSKDSNISQEVIQFLTENFEKMFNDVPVDNSGKENKVDKEEQPHSVWNIKWLMSVLVANFPYLKSYPLVLNEYVIHTACTYVSKNQRLNAVKFLKSTSEGILSLREAKDIVDFLWDNYFRDEYFKN